MAEFPFYGTLDNFVVNPSLEASSYDWTTYAWSGAGDRVRGAGAHGDYFYRLTASSAMSGAKGRYHDVKCPVKAGEKWTASIYVRPSVHMEMQAQGEFRTGAGVVGAAAQAGPITPCPAGEWTRISITLTAEGDATHVRHQTYMRGATLPAGGTLDLDAEMVSRGGLADFVDNPQISGVTEVSFATKERLGILSDVNVRTKDKIPLTLSTMAERLIAGNRISMAAAAQYTGELAWRWVQVTGPKVEIEKRGNTAKFIAPDVNAPTDIRVAVYAGSPTGAVRSDWGFFDLTIEPAPARYRDEAGGDFLPFTPHLVGYERGKREVWNDVVPPEHMDEAMRIRAELVDIGIEPDDIVFGTDFPKSAPADGVFVLLSDDPALNGTIYRNIGDGYNETDDTFAVPRRNAYWVDPATGVVSRWIEE